MDKCVKNLISLKKALFFKAYQSGLCFCDQKLSNFLLGQIWETKKSNLGYTKMNH